MDILVCFGERFGGLFSETLPMKIRRNKTVALDAFLFGSRVSFGDSVEGGGSRWVERRKSGKRAVPSKDAMKINGNK